MKEAFKIGGYAWHAHKRFEEIKDGWDFLKTVEWLKTIGIRFSNDSLRRFVNVYATYQSAQVAKGSLTEFYKLVNEQAAKVFAVTERTIRNWKPETAKQKRLSVEEIQKIQELKEEGKTQREIAEEIGVSQSAVNQNIRNDKCQNLSNADSPTPSYLEPDDDKALPISEVLGGNVIKAPVKFQRPEPLPDDEDEDEEDLDIEAPTTRSSW